MKTFIKALLITSVLVAGFAAWWEQRETGAGLRAEIANLQKARNEAVAQNERLRQTGADHRDERSAENVRADIEKTRQELAQAQQFWDRVTKQSSPPRTQHFTENRDPEKGPVLIKDFRNVGQATPSAAFQTMVWALAVENYEALVPLLQMSRASQDKLRAMVARMDTTGQARFNPPEKIVGLLMAGDVLREDGYQIGGVSEPDASGQVKLSVLKVNEGSGNKLEKKFPLLRGAPGWQVPIPDKAIDGIPAFLERASMFVPPSKSGG